MKQLAAEDRIWWGKNGDAEFPLEKRFLSEAKEGVVNRTWWPYEFAGSTRNASAELKALFGGERGQLYSASFGDLSESVDFERPYRLGPLALLSLLFAYCSKLKATG